jgi:putative transposase
LQVRFGQPTNGSIATIIGAFKSATSRRINALQHSYKNKLWQRNYYEHIIRDEFELYFIREYIKDNPLKWSQHKF